MKLFCIYHGGCTDGFASAWALHHLVDADITFYEGRYSDPPPDVTGLNVILVDFSYKKAVIDEMAKVANSILILDHHKSAAADLGHYFPAPAWEVWCNIVNCNNLAVSPFARVVAVFDMNRSGAGITWDYFSNSSPRPDFINYVEDRDLWHKKLPGIDEFTTALRSYPFHFYVWDNLVKHGVQDIITEGISILRYYKVLIKDLKRSAYWATLDNYNVMIVNVPKFASSEIAEELDKENICDFACTYFEVSAGKWEYSLRSSKWFDVSAVAVKYGGGGHAAAAGFTVDAPIHIPK